MSGERDAVEARASAVTRLLALVVMSGVVTVWALLDPRALAAPASSASTIVARVAGALAVPVLVWLSGRAFRLYLLVGPALAALTLGIDRVAVGGFGLAAPAFGFVTSVAIWRWLQSGLPARVE